MALENIETYIYEDSGYAIVPESETKKVFIPSPPTSIVQKINPRQAIIYLTDGRIDEDTEKLEKIKTYCKQKKKVFLCPFENTLENIGNTYEYILKNAADINIIRDQIFVYADADNIETAQEAVEYLMDELDADIEEAEQLDL